MTDEREPPPTVEMAALYATGAAIITDGLAFVAWMRRRVWMLRGIVFMNVACAAYNATNLGGPVWWLSAAGVALNVWGARKALIVEADFQGDIRKTLARLRELDQKIKTIERARHES